jgi:hypothetical protein
LRIPESRSYSPGRDWLDWSAAERTGFIKGFIVGHGDGYQSGCRAVESDDTGSGSSKSQTGGCLQQQHLFRKDVPFYEQFITDFYNRYSMDRDVPVRVLLLQLDDKSPDDIHHWLEKKNE